MARRTVSNAKIQNPNVDMGRRKFLKGLLCTAGAVATGCYGIHGRGNGCHTTETPFEENDSKLVIPNESRNFIIGTRIGHSPDTPLFPDATSLDSPPGLQGYKVHLTNIGWTSAGSGLPWDTTVEVELLDEAGRVVGEGDLNPFMGSALVSPTGTIISSPFAVFNPDAGISWAMVNFFEPGLAVNESWTSRKLRIEDCDGTRIETIGFDAEFSPGLASSGSAVETTGDLIRRFYDPLHRLHILGRDYHVGDVLPRFLSSGDVGEMTLYEELTNAKIPAGSQHDFSTVRLSVDSIGWDDEGIYATVLLMDLVSGDEMGPLTIRTPDKLLFGDKMLHLSAVPDGEEVKLFAFLYSNPAILQDGSTAIMDGKSWRVSMDYEGPFGTAITGLSLEQE